MRPTRPIRSLAWFAVAVCGCTTQPLDFDPPFGQSGDAGIFDLAATAHTDLGGVSAIDLAIVVGNGQTGDPCASKADCKGTKPVCILMDATGTVWPGGYCSSQCNPSKSDPSTGINSGCPGPAICDGQGTIGECQTFCDGVYGMTPCARDGYSCFFGCEPTALSECDPTQVASCPQDGGDPLLLDGGAYSGRACVRNGYDAVGICVDGCSPFDQGCPPEEGAPAACYASYDTGEGLCLAIYQGADAGAACQYLTECNPGLECFFSGNNQASCQPFCGGPNKLPCANGRACLSLGGNIPVSRVGICAP